MSSAKYKTTSSQKPQFPEVVVVQASAGSGKTYCLAKRYLKLLLNPELKPQEIILKNILAITFTNKATTEMKERILELLKRIALDDFSDSHQKQDILKGLDPVKARSKARLIIEELVRHYNSFGVQTIDSIINALLLGSSLNIDRSASFKIKRDYRELLAYCLDLVIEQALVDQRVLDFFQEFLEHYLFVENRSGWFPREDILELMQSLFKINSKYAREFKLYPAKPKEVIKAKKHIYAQLEKLSVQLPEGMNLTAKKSISSFIENSDPIFEVANLPGALRKDNLPMNKGKLATLDLNKAWKKIHQQIKELVEQEARIFYNPYIKFFQRLLEFLQEASKSRDLLFLEELNNKARLLFDQ